MIHDIYGIGYPLVHCWWLRRGWFHRGISRPAGSLAFLFGASWYHALDDPSLCGDAGRLYPGALVKVCHQCVLFNFVLPWVYRFLPWFCHILGIFMLFYHGLPPQKRNEAKKQLQVQESIPLCFVAWPKLTTS